MGLSFGYRVGVKSVFFISLGLVSIFWSGDRELFPQNRDLEMQFDYSLKDANDCLEICFFLAMVQ